jgi:hypothetical protein
VEFGLVPECGEETREKRGATGDCPVTRHCIKFLLGWQRRQADSAQYSVFALASRSRGLMYEVLKVQGEIEKRAVLR